MAVDTYTNFLTAVNAAAGATSSYYINAVNSDGSLDIFRVPAAGKPGVLFARVIYTLNANRPVGTDASPTGSQVIWKAGGGTGGDIYKYLDAQAFINLLNAN